MIKEKQIRVNRFLGKNLSSLTGNLNLLHISRAGEPKPHVFSPLSRSRLKKKQEAEPILAKENKSRSRKENEAPVSAQTAKS